MSLSWRRLQAADPDFGTQLRDLLQIDMAISDEVEARVRDIIVDVRQRGDAALLEYTRRFDHLQVERIEQLCVDRHEQEAALAGLPAAARAALLEAAARIRRYHEQQKQSSWRIHDEDGSWFGQQVRALDSVGIYVPGGKACYPSSVLMNAIPARVAGVEQVIMCVPTPGGEINPWVLAAAAVAGVDQVFRLGGAQAVAALAYGTQCVPAVDKIVGPGNIYVATAKRQVFGQVGIDMIAGPSEILVYADASARPDWVAMDLFSQAEHDEQAQAILVSDDPHMLEAVVEAANRLLPEMGRRDIISASIAARGAMILVADRAQAMQVINRVAPEHLELACADAQDLLPQIRHAGAIFLGHASAEALGDYCAGPNHVLPTHGTARFSSPLGVYDFQKRSSLIAPSAAGGARLGQLANLLAQAEGLDAHARSAAMRTQAPELL